MHGKIIHNFFIKFALLACILTGILSYENKSHAQETLEPNEFIFEVFYLPRFTITREIFAYEQNGKYYLPIIELSEGFEFYADSEVDKNYVQGFAGIEENSFILDGERNELIVKGEREELDDDAILIYDQLATDDIYVKLEVLNKIWPVEMYVELSSLAIFSEATLEDEKILPFVRRVQREEKRSILESRRELRDQTRQKLPFRDNPYQLLGRPVIDYQAIYEFETEEDDLTGQNIFSGRQQFGKTVADYSANFRLIDGEIERPDTVRLKFIRRSVGEDDIGISGVRNLELGDINIRQRDLIANTAAGRGIVFSNDNRDRNEEFDQITIIGTGPPGWEIELYNNEELIEFGLVPDDGEFIFEDVILNFGNNEIRILFFGPQGQVREELRRYRVGGTMVTPGEFKYNVGLLDTDRQFILLDNAPRLDPRGVTQTVSGSLGITQGLTVFGNYSRLPFDDRDHQYLTAGAALDTPLGLAQVEGYKEINGGNAFSLDLITSFLGVRANLGAALFNKLESEDAGFDGNRKTFEADAQLNRTVRPFGIPIGLRLNVDHTEREEALPVTNIDATQTFSRSGIRVSHSTSSQYTDYVLQQSTGALTTTIREGPFQLRGNVNYNIHPIFEIGAGNAEARYKFDDGFQGAVFGSHSFLTDEYSAGLQLGYDFEKFLGTFQTEYRKDNGWTMTARATTSLHPYTDDDSYTLSSGSQRNHAPVRANIYLDKNANGDFDEGDEPLPDVKLKVSGGTTKEISDENGVLIANTTANKLTNFKIDTRSLQDPYFVPNKKDEFSTIPLRGKLFEASFGVLETGAIEGTVYRESNGRAVTGLTVELITAEGEVLMKSETAFDGYFTFEFVPPGNYTIRAEAESGVTFKEHEANITPDELYLYGFDLYYIDGSGDNQPEDFIEDFDTEIILKDVGLDSIEDLIEEEGAGQFDDIDPDNQPEDFIQEVGAEIMLDDSGFDSIEDMMREEGIDSSDQMDQEDQSENIDDNSFDTVEPKAGFTNILKDIRFKNHDHKARLVIEVDQATQYEILPHAQDKLAVKITGAQFSHIDQKEVVVNDKKMRLVPEEGGEILNIIGEDNIELLSSMVVPSINGGPYRIFIDISIQK